MKQPPLIRLVDDDPTVAQSLTFVLEVAGLQVKSYDSAERFLAFDDEAREGCLLLDVRMPGMTGLEVQAELERRGSKLPILFLSAHGNIAMAVHAVRHGAADFLEKPVEPLDFVQKVSQVVTMSLQSAVTEAAGERLRDRFAGLTPRERNVIRAVLQGKQNKEVAIALGLEVSTVKMHRANAFAKLGVHSQSELMRLAFEAGVTAEDELLA